MAGSKFFWIVVAAILGANAIYFVAVGNHSATIDHLGHGDRFPQYAAVDFTGRSVDWKSKWALILFLSPTSEKSLEMAKYAAIIDQRFGQRGLKTVVILVGDEPQAESFAGAVGRDIAIVADESGWERKLGLVGHAFGLFLVNPDGFVEFASTRAEPDDVRQLVEANLVGEIDYEQAGHGALKLGDRLPAAPAQALQTGSTVSLADVRADFVVFFGPQCSVCFLEQKIASLGEFERARAEAGATTAGVFSGVFSETSVREAARNAAVTAPLYLAKSGLPGLEDEYLRQSLLGAEIVVLELDANGRVKGIARF